MSHRWPTEMRLQKFEKDNSPLLEAEISRLIKVSRETGYKKQDQIPHRDLADFKPMSINALGPEIFSFLIKPKDLIKLVQKMLSSAISFLINKFFAYQTLSFFSYHFISLGR